MCSVSHECAFFITWTETRKAELETNLTTNLQRRKQELEAIISSVDSDTLHGEDELKRQELNNAKSLAEVTTMELKSEL
jgi:structural maintenance of chromosome 3 (chondroitin sulfate proteoglycan 6)